MKRLRYLYLLAAVPFFPIAATAQQNAQWPFYLAFKDVTGARDTIWLVMDAMATSNMDPEFGEVPIDIPPNVFSTYIPFSFTEFTDTKAYNINYNYLELYIYSSHFSLPITIRWDRTLLSADILTENGGDTVNYAFMYNNYLHGIDQNKNGLNMHLHDSIVLPADNSEHFPLWVHMERGAPLVIQSHSQIELMITPNPAVNKIEIACAVPLDRLEIWDFSGRLLNSVDPRATTEQELDISDLRAGVYFLIAKAGQKRSVTKFVKVER